MKEIKLGDQKLRYVFKKKKGARNIRLSISEEAEITLSGPFFFSQAAAENFLREKAPWIFEKMEQLRNKNPSVLPKRNRLDYLKYKNLAEKIASAKLKHFNAIYNFSIGKISIRNQKTRWGSCSKAGNLNFNYRIIYLPEELCDYIIVHELCHLGEFNHSAKFWALVTRAAPDYEERLAKIRAI